MNRSARVMTLAGVLALACGAAFLGCGTGERPASPQSAPLLPAGASLELPLFSLTDQTGSRFGSASSMAGVGRASHLLPLSRHLSGCHRRVAVIQGELKGQDVRFVSFTVDPEHDRRRCFGTTPPPAAPIRIAGSF